MKEVSDLRRICAEQFERLEAKDAEIGRLTDLLSMAYPFVKDMVGIASAARGVEPLIADVLQKASE